MGVQTKATQKLTQVMSLNMLMWLTMLTLFAAILFLAATVYLALALVLAPALAALLTGVSLLGLSAVLAIVVFVSTHTAKPSRKPTEQSSATSHTDHDAGHDQDTQHGPGARAEHWVGNNPGLAVTGAVAVGVALSASPGLRRTITRTTAPLVAQLSKRALQELTRQR